MSSLKRKNTSKERISRNEKKNMNKYKHININYLTKETMILLLTYSNCKLNLEETAAVFNCLLKYFPDLIYSVLEKKYITKIPDFISKIIRIITFNCLEPNFVLLNSKNKMNEEIIVLKGSIELLTLEKKLGLMSTNEILNYLKNIKNQREDEIYRKCMKANNKLDTIINGNLRSSKNPL